VTVRPGWQKQFVRCHPTRWDVPATGSRCREQAECVEPPSGQRPYCLFGERTGPADRSRSCSSRNSHWGPTQGTVSVESMPPRPEMDQVFARRTRTRDGWAMSS
jgi:hypothetical protein